MTLELYDPNPSPRSSGVKRPEHMVSDNGSTLKPNPNPNNAPNPKTEPNPDPSPDPSPHLAEGHSIRRDGDFGWSVSKGGPVHVQTTACLR